jgi:hypothetical protein
MSETRLHSRFSYLSGQRQNVFQAHFAGIVLLLLALPLPGTCGSIQKLDSTRLARKTIEAIRISNPPRIDGKLDESFWKAAPVGGDFVEYGPRNGTEALFRSEIRIAYDDMAIYLSAVMYDPHPDSVCREMGKRDQIESVVTDYISFDILPYDDELNMYEFKVSPANLQNDCKYSAAGTDLSWDAVWESAAAINDSSWIAEVKIPYSALRFPRVTDQVWGINFWRNNQRYHEYSTWSWVDNKSQNIFRYYGKLTGMNHINPPVRLSFSPYLSGYVERSPDTRNWSWFLRGGLDLKYGINESYTLDMMLIPDFGQVQSDDVILNLSPFEIRYDEKRQFFTEATELFNKCEIFYTRRIGSQPRNYYLPYYDLKPGEKITENPDETRIINATKISGRNAAGLGIGFFNAMTTNTQAVIQDTTEGSTRKVMTQPYTNYNVLVLDQSLKNNSYITLINTNYFTPAENYSANVTGAETQIANRKNTFSFFGRGIVSQKYIDRQVPSYGYLYLLAVSKPSGKFQYQLLRQQMDTKYDPNDMGFQLYNNETYNRLRLSYYLLDPFWKFINTQTDFTIIYSTLYRPSLFKTFNLTLANQTTFRKYWVTVINLIADPVGFNDYYEPRTWGYVYKVPPTYSAEWYFASDSKKPFRWHHNLSIGATPGNKGFLYGLGFTPRMRFSDRFSVTFDIQYQKNRNDHGWVATQADSSGSPVIYFGRRDVTTISNVLSAKYIFNTKLSLTLRARHYWSQAEYLQYYTLNTDGTLAPSESPGNCNVSFNAFTADVQFIWYFAPGSEMSVVWKNLISTTGSELQPGYARDFSNMITSPQTNSFSIRVLYYLDYLFLKKTFAGKKKAPENRM